MTRHQGQAYHYLMAGEPMQPATFQATQVWLLTYAMADSRI